MAVAAILVSADLVTWFDNDTPTALIEAVKPDVSIKGDNWPADKVVSMTETFTHNSKVFSIPFLRQASATETSAEVREAGEGA